MNIRNKLTFIAGFLAISLSSLAQNPPISVPYYKPNPAYFNAYAYGPDGRPCFGGAGQAIYGYPNNQQGQIFKIYPLTNSNYCNVPITWTIDKYRSCINGNVQTAQAQPSDAINQIVYQTSAGDTFSLSSPDIASQVCPTVSQGGQTYTLEGCKTQFGQSNIILCCYLPAGGTPNDCDWLKKN